MKPCILLIEDDQDMRDLVAGHLEHTGFDVQKAEDGIKGQALALQYAPDLILLDLMLPKVDGLTLCQRLRRDERTAGIPILMITALGGIKDKVTGFNSGADDYITKPFSKHELLARIRAVLRRVTSNTEQHEVTSEILQSGKITLNKKSHIVTIHGINLDFSPREFSLLQLLMENQNRALSRDQMLESIWGEDWYGDTRTVDVHVRWLRQKIEVDSANPKIIVTVRGVGYRFDSQSAEFY